MAETKSLLELIRERISSKIVEPPKNMSSKDLVNWLLGYTAAQTADVKIIDEYLEEQK